MYETHFEHKATAVTGAGEDGFDLVAIALKQENCKSNTAATAIKATMDRLPLAATFSITIDQSSEFANFLYLEQGWTYQRRKIQSYYCDPRSTWQKVRVKNSDNRIRQYVQRTSICGPSPCTPSTGSHDGNHTPLKCLAFMTPAEAFP